MEYSHAMIIKRLIGTSVLTLLAAMSFVLTPLAGAVDMGTFTGGGDQAQGDILETQCANLGDGLGAALGCDTDDKIIDFTEYTGEFEGPDAAGYDEGLTQTTSAREFIQRIVNFALGFLGLIAVIMVLYGGARYLMSAGDEDAATKGKKTITYASIGIIIILGSFAFVNTLIGAGGGDTTGGLAGGTGGTTITEAGASFDVDAVLDEIERITALYLLAYDSYLTVSQEVAYMASVEMPAIVDVTKTDFTLGGAIEFGFEKAFGLDDSLSDQYQLIDERFIEDYLDELRESVGDIQGQVDSLSDTFEASQKLFNYLRSGSSFQTLNPILDWLMPTANALVVDELDLGSKGDRGDFADLGEFDPYVPGCEARSDMKVFDYGIGVTAYETVISNIDDNICGYFLPEIQAAADNDYLTAVDELLVDLQNLSDLFDTEGTGGSSLSEIVTVFQDAESRLISAKDTISNATARDIVSSMDTLYTLIQNIQFVQVRLTASATQGNAPLLVRFDALGTEDPSGLTVTDQQIEWDLDGDGDFDESLSGTSFDLAGASTSYIYDEPGTYRARVRVTSQSPNIAAGIANITIVVEPPRSIIVMEAEASGERTVLADYSRFPAINQDAYKVTETEAKEGVIFDASQSTDGNGNSTGLIFAEWDFGDNETVSGDWNNYKTVTHQYGDPGRYNVSLTITDQTGVQDRKYFSLYVASPAARMSNFPNSGPFGTEFTFDGSGSSTEIGTIVSHQWTATLNGQPYELSKTTGQRIEEVFEQPGIYTVTLTVTDSSQKRDSTSATVLVESREPVAFFEYEAPEPYRPARFVINAEGSYDPDEGDEITYDWDFDGTPDQDYRIIENKNEGEELIVEFLKLGNYDVTLTVADQHEGELQKTDSTTKTIEVDSLLDVNLTVQGEFTRYLNRDGEAEIEFVGTNESGAATGYEIDYGDGESDFSESISNGQIIFTHVYETAGVFYVTLTALDDADNKNSITKRVYIGAGDAPIAVLEVDGTGEDIGFGPVFQGNTKTTFSFDAGDSINTDGSNDNLEYSWNFGDGTTSNQSRVTHIYDEQAIYTVTLTVRDEDDASIVDQSSVDIEISGIMPEIRSFSIAPQGTSLETPLKVNMSVDASDEDGRITFVKGWYVDPDNSSEQLGTVVSQSTSFVLTVNTDGETGEVHEYDFYVEVTDNDNQTVSSFDELGPERVPRLEVINGPNDPPIASFSVDSTSIFLGDSIVFNSTSTDPDGAIISYQWDLEGDGFYNNEPQTSSSFEWIPSIAYPNGVEVQLKVEDEVGATAVSDPIRIFVDTLADPPEAAFESSLDGLTLTLTDESIFDTEHEAFRQGVIWDFNLNADSDGNGNPADDIDSTDPEAEYTYENYGDYTVRLTVVDNAGQRAELEREIRVIDAEDPYADFRYEVDDTRVDFRNVSTTDEDQDVFIRAYAWDFDLDIDSDGDGDSTNDVDSTDISPSHDYEIYGDYEVMLSIEDDLGQSDTITVIIEVNDPILDVEAVLSSVPNANALDQVILEGDAGDITFFYGANGGSGRYSFKIDKNIFFDTNGDGIRDNDVDFESDMPGQWTTHFDRAYGQIVSKLTVTDEENGERGIATLQVVFQGFLGSANLFNVTPNLMIVLLLAAIALVALASTIVVANSRK